MMSLVQPADPDTEAVQRVLAGDIAAFEDLVHRWQGPLVNLAFRFCRDRDRAEEMAQEAFLRAFRFLDRWGHEAAFSTWLFSLAINVYRSQMRRRRPPQISLDEVPRLAGSDDPQQQVEDAQQSEAVRRMVLQLPWRYREALILFYFHGMDVAEAARSLQIAPGTLKARLHRGRALLQSKLARLVPRRQPLEAL